MTIHHRVVPQSASAYCLAPPGEMKKIMDRHDIRRCQTSQLVPALRLGETLLESKLASPQIVATVDAITQMTIWITGNPVEGLYLIVPVTEEGRAAIESGEFNAADPALRHLAPANTPVFGVYCGVYAGATHAARKSVMRAAGDLRVNIFAPVPVYARGATEDGARSMLTLGFRPFEGGLPDLFISDPINQ